MMAGRSMGRCCFTVINRYMLCQVLLVVLMGCSSGASNMDTARIQLQMNQARDIYLKQKYPEAGFITAWGVSDNSQHEAELDAKARISEQISSTIRAEIKSIATASMRDGVSVDSQFLESKISSETRFNRAEMIQIELNADKEQSNAGFQAFAYLSRSELGDELVSSYENCATVFRVWVKKAITWNESPMRFTPAWKAAKSQFIELLALAGRYQAVQRQPLFGFVSDRSLLRDLEKARAVLIADLDIIINLQSSSGIDLEPMEAAVCGALVHLGLNAHTGECSAGMVLLVDLVPEVSWHSLMGARFCKVRLLGNIQDCRDRTQQRPVVVAGAIMEGRGQNPVDSLLKRVTSDSIAPIIAESFSDVLPINYLRK